MKDRNHYIQNRLLKYFAKQADNGKFKICIMDLINFTAELRNTDSVFYENKLYDLPAGGDVKELETKFATVIEGPMTNILKKVQSNSSDIITFTRAESETIRKYFLLQLYRTPHNKQSYTNPHKNSFEFSQFNIRADESKSDFWKREMLTILDTEWKSLLSTDMVGVKKHVIEINSCFTMIIKTNDEFCINDLGYVTERIPVQINPDFENEYIEMCKNLGKQLYGKDNFDEAARNEIENKTSYIDNYRLFPITSEYAILLVSPFWKYYLYDKNLFHAMGLYSPIISKYLSFPINKYVNEDKIKELKDVDEHLDPDDTYTFKIHTINEDETTFINHLIMNEAQCYIGLKTPAKFLKTVRMYNVKKQSGMKNVRNDLNGFVELLTQLTEK